MRPNWKSWTGTSLISGNIETKYHYIGLLYNKYHTLFKSKSTKIIGLLSSTLENQCMSSQCVAQTFIHIYDCYRHVRFHQDLKNPHRNK